MKKETKKETKTEAQESEIRQMKRRIGTK